MAITYGQVKTIYEDDPKRNTMLMCQMCRGEYSSNPNDYWHSDDYELVGNCCGQPLVLVEKTVAYTIIVE